MLRLTPLQLPVSTLLQLSDSSQQISKMGKNKKVKKVVGRANDRVERDEEADGSMEELAAAGMGLREPTAAAAEGSGGESMVPGDAGPPALSTLGDVAPQPAAVDPSPAGPPAGGVTATPGSTIEQRGEATRDAFRRAARLREAAALQDAGDARRTSGAVLKGAAAPGSEIGERTGLGVGYGVFDARYTPATEDAPFERYGKRYSDRKRRTEQEAQDWQRTFSGLRDEWMALHKTVRLFKVACQD